MRESFNAVEEQEKHESEQCQALKHELLEIVDKLDSIFHPRVGAETHITPINELVLWFKKSSEEYKYYINKITGENAQVRSTVDSFLIQADRMNDLVEELSKHKELSDADIQTWNAEQEIFISKLKQIGEKLDEGPGVVSSIASLN
jgi:chaperonin cofactor prefoldin